MWWCWCLWWLVVVMLFVSFSSMSLMVGLMVILERFFNGLTQDLFLLFHRRLDFGFWRWFLGLVFSLYWFLGPSMEGVFGLFVEVYIWYTSIRHIQTLFLCMLLFKSSSLAFLVLARILCVLINFILASSKKNIILILHLSHNSWHIWKYEILT